MIRIRWGSRRSGLSLADRGVICGSLHKELIRPGEEGDSLLRMGEEIPPLPPLAERCDVLVRQIELSARYRSEKVALLEARRHYCWYLKGVAHANYYKEQIVQMTTLDDLYRVTAQIKRDLR